MVRLRGKVRVFILLIPRPIMYISKRHDNIHKTNRRTFGFIALMLPRSRRLSPDGILLLSSPSTRQVFKIARQYRVVVVAVYIFVYKQYRRVYSLVLVFFFFFVCRIVFAKNLWDSFYVLLNDTLTLFSKIYRRGKRLRWS